MPSKKDLISHLLKVNELQTLYKKATFTQLYDMTFDLFSYKIKFTDVPVAQSGRLEIEMSWVQSSPGSNETLLQNKLTFVTFI